MKLLENWKCCACLIEHSLKLFPKNEIKKQEHIMREIFNYMNKADYTLPPPCHGRNITKIIRDITGLKTKDEFIEIKKESNKTAVEFIETLNQLIEKSKDPLFTATKISIAGNIIDFGIPSLQEKLTKKKKNNINDEKKLKLESIINQIIEDKNENESKFGVKHYQKYKECIEKSNSIIIIADNCGEVVFDLILIQTLHKLYKNSKKITLVVRSKPILNDISMNDIEDLESFLQSKNSCSNNPTQKIDINKKTDRISIEKMFNCKIISDEAEFASAGLDLNESSSKFIKIFNNSDMIISKGQGNYETLQENSKPNQFFLLKAKCEVISKYIKVKQGSLILQQGNQPN